MSELVYRSDHRAVLEVVADWKVKRQAFSNDLHALIGRHFTDGRSGLVVNGMKEIRFIGVEWRRGDTEPSSGLWRRDDRNGWVPRRTSNAGKALAAEMKAITAPNLADILPGMPAEYWDVVLPDCSQKVFHAGFVASQPGVLWVTWGTARMLDDPAWKVDGDLWERAKLSEFYTVIEEDVNQGAT